ncbi:hypothetical protein Pint_21374 [Pistacia integerrima]|uniref:Uncharacterized protein n=1 Tax=Pistacia integerrima TaxID=434235 RepID=A0ACC0XD14_9ROSI|nr:hypothetical protein Pint_21374 [Pistacia integerrima]
MQLLDHLVQGFRKKRWPRFKEVKIPIMVNLKKSLRILLRKVGWSYQIVLLILQIYGKSIFHIHINVNDTLVFNIFVLCQVLNLFNARK